MTDFLLAHWGDILLGINIPLLIANLVAILRNRRAQRALEVEQTILGRKLDEMQMMSEKLPLLHGMVGVASWRELPPEARFQVQRAMREILAEMDGEPLPTRH